MRPSRQRQREGAQRWRNFKVRCAGQRRVAAAIVDRFRAGEEIIELAKDYELPRRAVAIILAAYR